MPLFPVFDAERQSIWVGDTLLGSGRIWQLNIATGNYTAHNIKGANIVTQTVLAPDGKLWYIDPLAARPNSTLGVYDPDTGSLRAVRDTNRRYCDWAYDGQRWKHMDTNFPVKQGGKIHAPNRAIRVI